MSSQAYWMIGTVVFLVTYLSAGLQRNLSVAVRVAIASTVTLMVISWLRALGA